MRSEEFQAATADAYRAIGRFVVEFSRMCAALRNGTAVLVSDNGDSAIASRVELILGEAPAKVVADGFYGLLRGQAGLPEADLVVVKALKNETDELIVTRNNLLHGDWFVGAGAEGADVPMDPWIWRTKAGRTQPGTVSTSFTVAQLDELAEDAIRLATATTVVMMCLYTPAGPLSEAFEIVDGRAVHQFRRA